MQILHIIQQKLWLKKLESLAFAVVFNNLSIHESPHCLQYVMEQIIYTEFVFFYVLFFKFYA